MTARVVLFVLILVPLVGCGDSGPMASVRGKVTFKKHRIPEGRIEFVPEGPGKAVAVPIVGGKYRINRMPPGLYRVQIRAWHEDHDYIAPEAEGNDTPVEITEGSQEHSFAID
jgi:hypothetical protein